MRACAPRQEEAGPAEASALPCQHAAGGAGGAGITAQEDEDAVRQPAAVDVGHIIESTLYGFYIDFEGLVGAWKGLAISSP